MSADGGQRTLDGSRVAEVAAAVVVLAAAVGGFLSVPYFVSGWAFVMPGTTDTSLAPTFFPRIAMVVLGVAALGVMVTAGVRRDVVPLLEMVGEDWRRVGAIMLGIVAYFAALKFVGFLLASMVFMSVVPVILGYRRWATVITVALVAPLAIALVFRYGLKVILPAGLLGLPF